MKERFIQTYSSIADEISKLSRALRLQVGCIVVKNDAIISYGYNGTHHGKSNVCEVILDEDHSPVYHDEESNDRLVLDLESQEALDYNSLRTKPGVIHAEMNAIAKLAKSSHSSEGASMFVTHSPCVECAKLIVVSGIKEVFYNEEYRSDAGIKHLEENGVSVHKFNKEFT